MSVASPPTALEAGLRRVDEVAARTFGGWQAPGLAYGVVLGDELIHSGGLGTLRVGEDAPPRPDSVFRIASMTKSFTAATVLSLRDEGRLALDDPIDRFVPELADLRYPTADSPRITIRHLLTMTAGLPTDDPWGDRQQGLDLAAFSQLLRNGLSFAWAPGTRFEYSNLGYGILGRLITNVAGREYREVVGERLLRPLGMESTGYLEEEVEADRLARGYLWRDGEFHDEPIDGYGALAPMGGVFSTVEDLARWVSGFLDAFPPRDDAGAAHPLSRATRREMQAPQVSIGWRLGLPATAIPDLEVTSYGYGLFLSDDPRFGRVIGHSGGYPGFGSNMRWHPATGLGVIVLTNHRYGAATLLARELHAELLTSDATPVRRVRPSALTEAARDAVEELLARWDADRADALFAMNVELDEPIAVRRAFLERLRERHGSLTRDDAEPAESASPLHLVWWLDGSRGGRVRVEILLSPELPSKLQTMAVTSVPEPPTELTRAAERIVAALQTPEGAPVRIDWPAELAVAADLDLAPVVRSMRAVEARFAPVALGRPVEGDGERKATFRLSSPHGRLDLALQLDPVARCLDSVALTPVRLVPPDSL
jgi:serine-type D-Ala-D-Ala carboxypeptidase/endopeptidase